MPTSSRWPELTTTAELGSGGFGIVPFRLVVLASGAGTTLQALLDAAMDTSFGATVVAVGADRAGIDALTRAERAGAKTFTCRVRDYPTRAEWDAALTETVADFEPDLVVSAGFMK